MAVAKGLGWCLPFVLKTLPSLGGMGAGGALPGRAGTHKWNPGAAFASGPTWFVSPLTNWELLFPDLNYG